MADRIHAIYDTMWRDAQSCFAAGKVGVDSLIFPPEQDERRGIALLAWLRPQDNPFAALIERLRGVAPDLYYYSPAQYHTTVMSVVTMRDAFQWQSFPVETLRSIIADAVREIPPFDIHLRGISASSSVIVAQGFPDTTLNELRDKLRAGLRASGLDAETDTRYVYVAAHISLARFPAMPHNLPALVETLEAIRQANESYGVWRVGEIALVTGDYYLRPGRRQTLGHFALSHISQASM